MEYTIEQLKEENGTQCWACGYILNTNPLLQVQRNVEPCEVLVTYPEPVSRYYRRELKFRKYNTKGTLLKTELGIGCSQSYRTERIRFFDNEEECYVAYEEMCGQAIKSMKESLQKVIDAVESRLEKVNKVKNKRLLSQ